MTNPATTNANSASSKSASSPARPASPWLRWLGWLAHGFKIICIVGIVWFGWQAIVGMRTLLTPTVDTQTAIGDADSKTNGMPAPLPIADAGNWVVGDAGDKASDTRSGMEYGSVRVASAEIENYFHAATVAGSSKVAPVANARLASLLPMARQLCPEPMVRDARRIYRGEREGDRWQIVTEITPAGEQPINALFAARAEDRSWNIFQVTGQEQASENVQGILPLPAAARFAWGRKRQSGGWMMQSFELASPLSELTAAWKSAGWQIRPLGQDVAGEGAIASRGGAEVYAWIMSPAGNAQRTLLLLSLGEAVK